MSSSVTASDEVVFALFARAASDLQITTVEEVECPRSTAPGTQSEGNYGNLLKGFLGNVPLEALTR